MRGRRERHDASAVVLLYHQIADRIDDPFDLAVSPATFAKQMRYVHDTCCVLSLKDLGRALEAHSLPPRAVVITFDDGYADNAGPASETLVELGLPATFFLVTSLLEHGAAWWEALVAVLRRASDSDTAIWMQGRKWAVNKDSFRSVLFQIHAELAPMSVAGCAEVLRELSDQFPTVTSDWGFLQERNVHLLASRLGHDVGSHTAHHLSLPDRPADEQVEELESSRRHLSELVGRPIDLLAYPYGRVSPATAELARRCGFRIGVSTVAAAVRPDSDLLQLPRVEVSKLSRFEEQLEAFLQDTSPRRQAT